MTRDMQTADADAFAVLARRGRRVCTLRPHAFHISHVRKRMRRQPCM